MGTHLEERERGLQERGTALQAQIEQATAQETAQREKGKAEQASSAIAPSTFASATSGPGKRQHLTDAEWFDQWKPRIEGLMWSASAFDDRRAQSAPELYCMVGNDTGSCRCVTEPLQAITGQAPRRAPDWPGWHLVKFERKQAFSTLPLRSHASFLALNHV